MMSARYARCAAMRCCRYEDIIDATLLLYADIRLMPPSAAHMLYADADAILAITLNTILSPPSCHAARFSPC